MVFGHIWEGETRLLELRRGEQNEKESLPYHTWQSGTQCLPHPQQSYTLPNEESITAEIKVVRLVMQHLLNRLPTHSDKLHYAKITWSMTVVTFTTK